MSNLALARRHAHVHKAPKTRIKGAFRDLVFHGLKKADAGSMLSTGIVLAAFLLAGIAALAGFVEQVVG
jgi:hypothetical protein